MQLYIMIDTKSQNIYQISVLLALDLECLFKLTKMGVTDTTFVLYEIDFKFLPIVLCRS